MGATGTLGWVSTSEANAQDRSFLRSSPGRAVLHLVLYDRHRNEQIRGLKTAVTFNLGSVIFDFDAGHDLRVPYMVWGFLCLVY